jgi:hypothetical protein
VLQQHVSIVLPEVMELGESNSLWQIYGINKVILVS